mgnify:CR=1 FL=1|jgi:hypothetical protein
MRNKITINYLALFFIIPFSGFYITVLPLSPIYFFVLFGILLSIFILLIKSSIKNSLEIYLSFLILLYFSISQQIFFIPNISTYVNFNFSIVVFIVSYVILYKTNSNTIINISEKLIYFSLPLLMFEAYYRYTHPISGDIYIEKGREDLLFYIYKMNSVMYQDSNFVGIFILCLFFFLLYIKQFGEKKYYISFSLLIILTFATLSRASIISLVFFSILYLARKKIYKYRYLVTIITVISITLLFPILIEYKNFDESFATRFHIFDNMMLYLSNTDLISLFFGAGFGNSVDVLNRGAHNFFMTYLVESGIIGTALIIIFWSRILYITKFKAGIIMFPFLLNGLAFASGAIPYLYAIFAITIVLESRRIGKCKIN